MLVITILILIGSVGMVLESMDLGVKATHPSDEPNQALATEVRELKWGKVLKYVSFGLASWMYAFATLKAGVTDPQLNQR